MKQISSLELHFILKELEVLKDSRVNKIYHPQKNLLVFSFYKTNSGKKILQIDIGKTMFLIEEKENHYETLGFGMLLRKHLDGCFLYNIEQIKPERIVKLSLKSKDSKKFLYIEFFGKGNAILCDENNLIINSLEHHDFKGRAIMPKLKYSYPVMKYNFFELAKEELSDLLKNSKKETLVTCLAVELGLGGLYSEEICLLSYIDKNQNPKHIDERGIELVLNSIKQMLNKKISAQAIFRDDSLVDFAPFELRFYDKCGKKKFQSFNEALEFFYSQFKEVKESEFERKLRSLQRIAEEQKLAIEELKKEEKELREKGELIYHKYSLIKEILEELGKASKKYSWKEIKERLKGHNVIKEVNEKDRKILIEV